jgi:aquaglyceroporin related protein, other eukaryote
MGTWMVIGFGEEIPLKAYDPETDEIYNLHTHWSVIRLRLREPLAELLAVSPSKSLCLVSLTRPSGYGPTHSWLLRRPRRHNLQQQSRKRSNHRLGLGPRNNGRDLYRRWDIWCAPQPRHLHNALHLQGLPLRKVPIYVFAQILGAFLAGLIAFGLFQKNIIEFGGSDLARSGMLGSFITNPRYEWIDAGTGFFTEFTGTAILAVAVLALGDDTNASPGAGMNAFVLGLIITVLSMAFGYNTGAVMNPTRDLGPRLACLAVGYGGQNFRNGYWIYGPWAATINGAVFGAFLYDAAIFVGGDSPVNCPRRRIKRWGARLRRTRRRLGVG